MIEKWKSLKHNGPVFPPEYVYSEYKIKVNKKIVVLSPEAEEIAYLWASKSETEYIKDEVFQKNFWKDFSEVLPPELKKTNFPSDWDFSLMYKEILKKKENKLSKKEKKALKKQKEEIKETFGYAEIDGKKMELGNYIIEPIGLFMGRGQHPKRGSVKAKIQPEDIEINIGKNDTVPSPPTGHKWGKISTKPGGLWTALWIEKVTGKPKRIMFSRSSAIVQGCEEKKFNKAKKLAKNMQKVNDYINQNLTAKNKEKKMIATVCRLIATLAIRVGDEKDKDEADTVGASTLRAEHVKIDGNKIILDFLGKDSIPYHSETEFNDDMISNMKDYVKGKKEGERLFPLVTSIEVRDFLSKVQPKLTAKVFRTATASMLLSNELKNDVYTDMSEEQKVHRFIDANLIVAKKLNHQSAVSKTFSTSMEKLNEKIKKVTKKLEDEKDEKKQEKLNARMEKITKKIELKEKTKGIALGTSKTNYIDPRIVISWAKTNNVDISKLLTEALIKKFSWAKSCEEDFYLHYGE